jgi:hypothetical protein
LLQPVRQKMNESCSQCVRTLTTTTTTTSRRKMVDVSKA